MPSITATNAADPASIGWSTISNFNGEADGNLTSLLFADEQYVILCDINLSAVSAAPTFVIRCRSTGGANQAEVTSVSFGDAANDGASVGGNVVATLSGLALEIPSSLGDVTVDVSSLSLVQIQSIRSADIQMRDANASGGQTVVADSLTITYTEAGSRTSKLNLSLLSESRLSTSRLSTDRLS